MSAKRLLGSRLQWHYSKFNIITSTWRVSGDLSGIKHRNAECWACGSKFHSFHRIKLAWMDVHLLDAHMLLQRYFFVNRVCFDWDKHNEGIRLIIINSYSVVLFILQLMFEFWSEILNKKISNLPLGTYYNLEQVFFVHMLRLNFIVNSVPGKTKCKKSCGIWFYYLWDPFSKTGFAWLQLLWTLLETKINYWQSIDFFSGLISNPYER